MRVLLASWFTLQVAATSSVVAQSAAGIVFRGRVIDARTATPLRDVTVVLTSGRDTVARARSDSVGAFQAAGDTASREKFVAHFTRIGYRADSIAARVADAFPLRVAMIPVGAAANALAAVVVRDSTARGSFEQRARRSSGGKYIRAAEIVKRKPVRTSELFRSYPGVRLDDSSGVTQLVSLRSMRETGPVSRDLGDGARMPGSDARRCVLRVATDGRLMPLDFSVDDIRPEDIEGIELYLGAATIPAEFSSVQHDAPCGIIMIWTKKGAGR